MASPKDAGPLKRRLAERTDKLDKARVALERIAIGPCSMLCVVHNGIHHPTCPVGVAREALKEIEDGE